MATYRGETGAWIVNDGFGGHIFMAFNTEAEAKKYMKDYRSVRNLNIYELTIWHEDDGKDD